MEKAQRFLSDNPIAGGVFIMVVGIFLLFASIFNWQIIYGDISHSNYDLNKIDGWTNIFGRKTARIVGGVIGVVIIAAGVLWMWLG